MHRVYKTYQYLLLGALALAWGCRKDVEDFRPYTPTQEDLAQLFLKAPDNSTHTVFPLGGSIPDTTLTTASGVRVFLADTEHLFADDAGTPVPCSTCPSLKVEVTTVLSKGDLAARGLPTSAVADGQLLESVGVVQVQANCAGKNLNLLPNRYLKIQIPTPEVKSNMNVYAGTFDDTDKFTGWKASGASVFWADWPLPGGGLQTGYELIVPELGYSNCARPIVEQTSSFCVTLPGQFSALNTRVFLVFDNIRTVAELQGTDDSSEFCYPGAPLGYPVKIVAVSKTGGQYWLTNQFTEIGSNVKMSVAPLPQSEADILTFIKGL